MPKAAPYRLTWNPQQKVYALHDNCSERVLSMASESQEWFALLANIPSFAFSGQHGQLTVRQEAKSGGGVYWNAVFLALSDPTRRAILERLAQGEASGTELAQPFLISVPAISKHLHVLEQAALIVRRKEGRVHRFRLAVRSMREAATWLEQYRQFWETQFDELATYLEATSEEEKDTDDPSSI